MNDKATFVLRMLTSPTTSGSSDPTQKKPNQSLDACEKRWRNLNRVSYDTGRYLESTYPKMHDNELNFNIVLPEPCLQYNRTQTTPRPLTQRC